MWKQAVLERLGLDWKIITAPEKAQLTQEMFEAMKRTDATAQVHSYVNMYKNNPCKQLV